MMFQRLHIALILLLWVLPYSADLTGNQQPSASIGPREGPKLEKSGTPQPNTDNSGASYFGIHQQAEASVELLNHTRIPSVSGDTDRDSCGAQAVEANTRKKDAIHLLLAKIVWCSQASANILYPFHFFL